MILLWGISTDDPLQSVRAALARQNAPVIFLDQQQILSAEIDLTVTRAISGTIRSGKLTIPLDTITAVYLRPYDTRRMRAVERAGLASSEYLYALAFEDALLSWLECTNALVINRPSAMASNNSKPYQAMLIRAQGFRTPETLITTDPRAARAFWKKHGDVIYKSVSGVRSIVSRLRPEHRDRLADIANCPTQFQRYIPGIEYRVHVIGDKIFASEILSNADDYRYPGEYSTDLAIQAFIPSPELSAQCLRLTHSLGLVIAGIDLRRTPQGEWYCFEVNPSPGFTFYQQATGQPMSTAIADLLMQNQQ